MFKKHCCRKQQRKTVYVAGTGCADDDAAVAALPEKWVPKHSGPVLTKYLKDQEHLHNTVIDDTFKEAAFLNSSVDLSIRKIAENLLTIIKQNESDMSCVVEDIDIKDEPLAIEIRNDALRKMNQLYNQRIDELSAFRSDAMALERKRADDIRKLLQSQFQRLISIGLLPPKTLLHEFDQRAYEVNQQLLSNSRAFAELEAQLHAQADEYVVQVKSNLNQLCLGLSLGGTRHSAFPWHREDKIPSKRLTSASSDKKLGHSDPSVNRFMNEVVEYDECVTLLVQAYKAAVLKLVHGFSGKLTDLHSRLGWYSFLEFEPKFEDSDELHAMIGRILLRLSNNIQKNTSGAPELADLTRHSTVKIQQSLSSLGERLRDTYSVLHDSGHLWDAHMLRSALAQKLTMACVEDLLTSNDSFQLANEVNFNIALEQLRSTADQDKLPSVYESVCSMLEKIVDLYKLHNENECNKLEEFMSFPDHLSKTLMSEFYCFLEKFPRLPVQIQNIPNRHQSDTLYNSSRLDGNALRMPLPRVILQTELQEAALLNWRNGFLETFQNNATNMPDELRRHARIWVEEKTRALRMRHALKFASHSVRLERLKAAYDNRLTELKNHDSRLESHLNAVQNLVDELPAGAAEFLSLDAPELYPFCYWIGGISANINDLMNQDPVKPETKKLKMRSYAARIQKHRMLFEKSLEAAIECAKRQVGNRVQEARISNVRFVSQLHLFSEGGRYSAPEATKTCTALMKGAEVIELCLTRALEALNHRRSQILSLADQMLMPINKIVDEFVKGAKGAAADKRKPPAKKK